MVDRNFNNWVTFKEGTSEMTATDTKLTTKVVTAAPTSSAYKYWFENVHPGDIIEAGVTGKQISGSPGLAIDFWKDDTKFDHKILYLTKNDFSTVTVKRVVPEGVNRIRVAVGMFRNQQGEGVFHSPTLKITSKNLMVKKFNDDELLNDWTNSTTNVTEDNAQVVVKKINGMVFLEGTIMAGTIPTTTEVMIFQLPKGFRPKRGLHIPCISRPNIVELRIALDGQVYLHPDYTYGSWVVLNGSWDAYY